MGYASFASLRNLRLWWLFNFNLSPLLLSTNEIPPFCFSVILFPIAVTFYITWWFFCFVDGFFSPIYAHLGINIIGMNNAWNYDVCCCTSFLPLCSSSPLGIFSACTCRRLNICRYIKWINRYLLLLIICGQVDLQTADYRSRAMASQCPWDIYAILFLVIPCIFFFKGIR
jgi:hypothetical protein